MLKITKTDLNKLIKEEYSKMVKASKLQKRLQEINSELSTLQEGMEDEGMALGEVEKTGETSGKEWYQKDTPVAGFEKLKSHEGQPTGAIKEDDLDEEPKGEIEMLAAELGKAIDKKISGGAGASSMEEPIMGEPKIEEPKEEPKEEPVDETKMASYSVGDDQHLSVASAEKEVDAEKEGVKEAINEGVRPSAIGTAKKTNTRLVEELNRMKVLAKIL